MLLASTSTNVSRHLADPTLFVPTWPAAIVVNARPVSSANRPPLRAKVCHNQIESSAGSLVDQTNLFNRCAKIIFIYFDFRERESCSSVWRRQVWHSRYLQDPRRRSFLCLRRRMDLRSGQHRRRLPRYVGLWWTAFDKQTLFFSFALTLWTHLVSNDDERNVHVYNFYWRNSAGVCVIIMIFPFQISTNATSPKVFWVVAEKAQFAAIRPVALAVPARQAFPAIRPPDV